MSNTNCFHCGDSCVDELVKFDNKSFCCNGCKSVYEILNHHQLDDYYDIESAPGTKNNNLNTNQYKFLDLDEIADTLYDFKEENKRVVRLFLPEIHCASCVWLLENLNRINEGVYYSEVNFLKKEALISFDITVTKFSELAVLLHRIGYPPKFDSQKEAKSTNKKLLVKLGVTFFCFGNVMLFSFPEYLNPDETFLNSYRTFFSYLIFGFSIPVLIYSAKSYLVSAFKALRSKSINLDVPISLGILTLYGKSVFDIFSNNGPGYMDSFVGFVLFLLAGKWFQEQSYQALSFNRNYKSYFPLAVTQLVGKEEIIKPVENVKKKDILVIRNEEIIPTDSILMSETASIDYSFVTGESTLVKKKKGDALYAGGKQVGSSINVEVSKQLDQSYLTQLWNQNAFKKDEYVGVIDFNSKLSNYFIAAVIVVAALSAIAWTVIDATQIVNVVVAVLIVACPCALALSIPFTFGNSLRVAGSNGLYLKNSKVVEQLGKVTDIVFDKTGTLTKQNDSEIVFIGDELSNEEQAIILSVVSHSSHPLSRLITSKLKSKNDHTYEVENFLEHTGKGVEGEVKKLKIKIGSKDWLGVVSDNDLNTKVYISINEKIKGYYRIQNTYRKGLESIVGQLSSQYKFHVLSGDNESERDRLETIFGNNTPIYFNQKPIDKLNYIQGLKSDERMVMMVGDGLNDAGALKQSDIGVVIAEDVYSFSPACDAIMDASEFKKLPNFLNLGKYSLKVLKISYTISLLYNTIGLAFALTNQLSPLIAAILMPISSISVVFVTTILIRLFSQKHFISKN